MRMKILIVTPTLPAPVSGGQTRLYNLVKQLSIKHELFVLSFVQPGEKGLLDDLTPFCKRVLVVPFDGFKPKGKWRNRLDGWTRILFDQRPRYVETFPVEQMRGSLRRLLTESAFDVVVFEQLFLVELSTEIHNTPMILVEQNVESDIALRAYRQKANAVHKMRDWLIFRKLVAYEQEWLPRFPVCVAVSGIDADRLRQLAPQTEVFVVPNGVDVGAFAPPRDDRQPDTLLFFGTLNYGPNLEGLLWFCREALPLVRNSVPDVRLRIVGKDPPPAVVDLKAVPGVELVGFVPDVRPELWSSTLSIVPLHRGGGTRLKILEALAAGCPVISTSVGAEGLHLIPDQDLLVADSAKDFAIKTIRLLEDPALRKQLAKNGRRAVTARYDWRSIARQMESACVHASDTHSPKKL